MGVGCLMVMAIVAFNWVVNPFDSFSPPVLVGVNDVKGTIQSYERFYKACEIERVQPGAVILGSSRANAGISARHPGWQHGPVYNAAVSGASLDLVAAYFEHATVVAPVRQALILLDYGSPAPEAPITVLPEQRWLEEQSPSRAMRKRRIRFQHALFSWDALSAGIQGLMEPAAKGFSLPDGALNIQKTWERMVMKQGPAGNDGWLANFDVKHPPFMEATSHARDFSFLRQIIRLAAERDVELKFVISPVHDLLWRRYLAADGMDCVLSWRREVLISVEEESARWGKLPPPVWDFALGEYSCMSPEEISLEAKGGIPLYLESSHFTPRMGDRILDRVLLDPMGPDPGMGVRLSQPGLDEHLEKLRFRWRALFPPQEQDRGF